MGDLGESYPEGDLNLISVGDLGESHPEGDFGDLNPDYKVGNRLNFGTGGFFFSGVLI